MHVISLLPNEFDIDMRIKTKIRIIRMITFVCQPK